MIEGLDEQDLQEWGNFGPQDPFDLDDGGVEIEGLNDADLQDWDFGVEVTNGFKELNKKED